MPEPRQPERTEGGNHQQPATPEVQAPAPVAKAPEAVQLPGATTRSFHSLSHPNGNEWSTQKAGNSDWFDLETD